MVNLKKEYFLLINNFKYLLEIILNNRIILTIIFIILVSIISTTFIKYIFLFGGDPDIHIIFAKNLLKGYFLQFNPGIYSSGETSIGYMFFVALVYLVFGKFTAVIMKLTGIFSLVYIFKIIKNNILINDKKYITIFLLSILVMPFILFQALLSMENMPFAAIIIFLINYYYKKGFTNTFISFFIPFLTFVRPEFIFFIFFILVNDFLEFKKINKKLILGCALTFTTFIAIEIYTGVPIHGAGLIRRIISRDSSFEIFNGYYLNYKPLRLSLYFWPLYWFFIKNISKIPKNDKLLFLSLFVIPFLLHLFNILPNVQFSRYFLFETFVIFYIFSKTLNSKNYKIIILFFCFNSLFVSLVELTARISNTTNESIFTTIFYSDDNNVRIYSDEFLVTLASKSKPVNIAMQEVQYRLRLDNRFNVWALDGITDNQMTNFVSNGYFDHFSYLKYRNINYLIGTPNYNWNKNSESLYLLKDLKFNESKCIKNILFTKLTVSLLTEGVSVPEPIYKLTNCIPD